MIDTLYIAADHAGVDLKNALKAHIEKKIIVYDLGTDSSNSVDYPDYAEKVCQALKQNNSARGVLICGTGIGMSIAANRHRHIRAALCATPEAAKMARLHNDANVLVLGARVLDTAQALAIVDAFLATDFEGGRHAQRVAKFS
ncbi:MAG: ribose 5-phosphate isomerase B [Alphaproteobacteria bacterium]|jgi:ribose 5-phosphate isomerase B|nr:ribose 5-phosphate isomerase B [Alphaproteobacteria bacterium]